MNPANHRTSITIDIDTKRIGDLLCEGIEQGIAYWAEIVRYISPTDDVYRWDSERRVKHVDYPLNPGGVVVLREKDKADAQDLRLDHAAVLRGLEVMRKKYPAQFARWIAENDDAETGDVFIQCCLFGRTKYG